MNYSYMCYIDRLDDNSVLNWLLSLSHNHSLAQVTTIQGHRVVLSRRGDTTRLITFQDGEEVLPPRDGLYFVTRFSGCNYDEFRGSVIDLMLAWYPTEELKPFVVSEFLSSKFGLEEGDVINDHWTQLDKKLIPKELEALIPYYNDFFVTELHGTTTPDNPKGVAILKTMGRLDSDNETVFTQAIELIEGQTLDGIK